ncbi:MAG: sigma-54-dependent Fis family transcriptional regulator [Deltaproteobacteria bacterium]|nr:sigma-54-dependent Fis family transcriptional regulator [Deltaproteobacteria bacterium]MBW2308459.1 sigma-54-dependent Fis family transcriptional regulator [Deltaproteobacteria bacterium]
MNKAKILVVDDHRNTRDMIQIFLKDTGYDAAVASDGKAAEEMLGKERFDLVIADIRMPRMDGMSLLHRIKEAQPHIQVIIITAFSSRESAMEAMKEGAYDYVPKPFKSMEHLGEVVRNALRRVDRFRREEDRTVIPEEEKPSDKTEFPGFCSIVGQSPEMLKIFDLIRRVAATPSNVLITGESGTGKELVARAIHTNSLRRKKPFIPISCGGIPETLMESELFGHRKGAFTGATMNKQGLFEVAHQGTIFLDEIGELTHPIQVKLLRVVQDKTFKNLGGTEDIHVDVRIISATNKILEQEVIAKRFREDLFYRLDVIHVHVPPLRERREDIPILTRFFLEKYRRELGKEIHQISSYAMELLLDYHFPGNVRELENIIERSVALETSNIILPESLAISNHKFGPGERADTNPEIPPTGVNLEQIMENIERAYLLQALERSNGVKKKAAELLGLDFRSFRYRLEKYDIK